SRSRQLLRIRRRARFAGPRDHSRASSRGRDDERRRRRAGPGELPRRLESRPLRREDAARSVHRRRRESLVGVRHMTVAHVPVMCMDRSSGETAADLLARTAEHELADTIYAYGEERFSRRIARAIVEARREAPIATTVRLATIVRRAIPRRGYQRIDPATRTF